MRAFFVDGISLSRKLVLLISSCFSRMIGKKWQNSRGWVEEWKRGLGDFVSLGEIVSLGLWLLWKVRSLPNILYYSVEWKTEKMCCFSLKNSRLWFTLPIENGIKKEWTSCDAHSCDPGGIQTHNPHIRSVVLYSVEPRDQGVFRFSNAMQKYSIFQYWPNFFATFFHKIFLVQNTLNIRQFHYLCIWFLHEKIYAKD